MKEKQTLPFDALTKGYILLPKPLLAEWLPLSALPLNDLDAWLTVLTTVNFKETLCFIEGQTVVCKRGESLLSIGHWSIRFGWTRGKTRRYFNRLQRQGLVRITSEGYTTRLQVSDYELWAGCRTAAREHLARKTDEEFDLFWDEYHRITLADKVNVARARREWGKLSPEERTLATRHIEEYYYHLRNVKYCMQAAAYLSNKAFLNEYTD